MTAQEQQMIDGLISRIRATQLATKDAEAEQHIQQNLASFPDALYVLVQTVLVQQYGLEQAQSQIGELKQQIQTLQAQAETAAQQPKPAAGGSFLSHIFGSGQTATPQPPPPQQTGYQPVNSPGYAQGYPAGGYPPPPPPAYPTQYPTSGGMFGGGGGFLQGALQTAAGVAAGEMVFQGMEDLFHGFGGHERGFGGGMGGGETVVNNYYDDDRRDDREIDRSLTSSDRDNSSFYNPSGDASRDNFTDTGNNDLSFDDNSSNDDNSFDDSSSNSDDSFVDDNS